MKEYQNISHGFGPVYNRESRILILGSFPSVKSREQAFFYGHPRNRFWKVLAAVLKVGYILICKVIVMIIFAVLAIRYWVGEYISKAEE